MGYIGQLGSRESLDHRGCRSLLNDIMRTVKCHEIALAEKIKENPKKYCKDIKSKWATREKIM